ncbi:microtubule-associated protein 6 [Hypanus sabinus]|uniref:microtubule-associated protein 6 n=1 Tax=Hypanus sabinus TaxID=79690 RepID=UPI0028C3AC5D|nr:microtubule-associated protein 6 [Hypanus sabinus]
MAWPCISRACCIARFWNQLDKADIAVPLVFTKYSEVTDGSAPHPSQFRAPGIEAQPVGGDQDNGNYRGSREELPEKKPGLGIDTSRRESVMRQDYRPWKVRPEPSCKPKQEYTPTDTPFEKETQYKKDFKAWPIPKRSDQHPWIPKGERGSQTPVPSGEEPGGSAAPMSAGTAAVQDPAKGKAADALNRQIKEDRGTATSYRNEFRAWTVDVKPTKAIKPKQTYHPPEAKVAHETSYNTTFRGQFSKRPEMIKPGTADSKGPERRIRSLYSEFYREPAKPEKPSTQISKPKKPSSHKTPRKAKEKHSTSSRAVKKKAAESTPPTNPEEGEKNQEINNKLAEAKE